MRESKYQSTYWIVEYVDGTKVDETQLVDWLEIDKKRVKRLSLRLPNGRLISLEREPGYQPFQIKVGIALVGGPENFIRSQIIGMVINKQGDCILKTYDYKRGRPVEIMDNVYNLKYENIGRLNFRLLGLDLPEIITL